MKLISIETQIIKATINTLLSAGFEVSVFDGEEIVVERLVAPDMIFEAMKTTDEDYLRVYMRGDRSAVVWGWVRFIYGNDGTDVINDYSTNLESIMGRIFAMIDEYEER